METLSSQFTKLQAMYITDEQGKVVHINEYAPIENTEAPVSNVEKEVTPKKEAMSEDGVSVATYNVLLKAMLEKITTIDFKQLAAIDDGSGNGKLSRKDMIVLSIEEAINISSSNDWGLCKMNGGVYVFNGSFWGKIEKKILRAF